MAVHVLRRGARFGKYRLDRRLGRGSFSDVWRAQDTIENRPVALKIILPEVEREYGRAEIEREARIASRLEHPNIVAVRNADWIGGRFVIATDLAASSLAGYPGARRSARLALQVIRDVAAGLAHAHSKRVLHLDLKPDNILIFPDRRAGIGDFGTSRLAQGAATRTYTEAGTLGYLAPEQAYGRPRLASDVFSLGLIALEILTGKRPMWPFGWPPAGAEKLNGRVPESVQRVLRRASTFEPDRRFPDGIAFARALEDALRREDGARSPRRRRRPRKAEPSPLAIASTAFRRRFGKSLELHYRCYKCRGPIAEAMHACPWCGAGDHSFRDVTNYPLVCPECERGVRAEWACCPWCYAGRFQGSGRPPRAEPRAERRCSRRGCDGQLRVFMRYCPLCKHKPRRVWSHPALPDRCPRCRWPVSREFWRHCPWCGRNEPRAGTFVRR